MSALRTLLLAVSGFTIATVGAICGIGGGLFAVPLLHYGMKLSLQASVATSCALVAATTTAATLSESTRVDSQLHWGVVALLSAGALVGSHFGFRFAQRVETKKLKLGFAVVLVVAGLRLGWSVLRADTGAAVVEPPSFEFDVLRAATALAIGFGGGFVAPLLGIGGGLIAVPGLFFGLPGLGYLGARAASLAMGAVNGWRSLYLWSKKGEVDFKRAAPIALGALGGAWVGTSLVHLEGAEPLAKALMSVCLLAVSLRFVRDAR